jgi:hypothetical protein
VVLVSHAHCHIELGGAVEDVAIADAVSIFSASSVQSFFFCRCCFLPKLSTLLEIQPVDSNNNVSAEKVGNHNLLVIQY